MDFEIFDEGLQRIIEIYSGASEEDVEKLNYWINELGLTCTNYVEWYATGTGWESQEVMESYMSDCAAEIASLLSLSVTTIDYLKWWADGWSDVPLVWCEIGGTSGDCYWAEARLAQPEGKPSLWDWNKSNGSASAEQTQLAYSAVNGNGLITDFSHEVWNDMVSKVVEILTYISSSWTEIDNTGNTYLPYEDTMMSVNDTTLTADRFNSLRFNIGSRQSTGINPVAIGDTVYGWYFTQLTDVINNWINSI